MNRIWLVVSSGGEKRGGKGGEGAEGAKWAEGARPPMQRLH